MTKSIAIIGGGPAGLMAAEAIADGGLSAHGLLRYRPRRRCGRNRLAKEPELTAKAAKKTNGQD